MALPFVMLAVLFRGIENFKMFDMVNLLTSGGPGSTTEVASITLKREAFEKWRTGFPTLSWQISAQVRGGQVAVKIFAIETGYHAKAWRFRQIERITDHDQRGGNGESFRFSDRQSA